MIRLVLLLQAAIVLQAFPKDFWNVDAGSAAVILGLVLQSLLLLGNSFRQHGENKQKIKELLEWKEDHERDATQRDQAIRALEGIAARMEETAEGIRRQMDELQKDVREIRRGRGGKGGL